MLAVYFDVMKSLIAQYSEKLVGQVGGLNGKLLTVSEAEALIGAAVH